VTVYCPAALPNSSNESNVTHSSRAPSFRQTASMMIPSQIELVLVRDVLSALLHGTIAGLAPPWTLAFIESRAAQVRALITLRARVAPVRCKA
jgi:hypothetical protein